MRLGPGDVIREWAQLDMYIYGNMTNMAAFLVQGLTSTLVYLVCVFKLTRVLMRRSVFLD